MRCRLAVYSAHHSYSLKLRAIITAPFLEGVPTRELALLAFQYYIYP
jgi:hypothetical protein